VQATQGKAWQAKPYRHCHENQTGFGTVGRSGGPFRLKALISFSARMEQQKLAGSLLQDRGHHTH
jgi:hypothetical protein